MTHIWFSNPDSWLQGWIAEQVDDHWEVYYTPTERMRIGANDRLGHHSIWKTIRSRGSKRIYC
jgi:hypothetical protein